MDIKKEKLLIETNKKFIEACLNQIPFDEVKEFISENIMGYGTNRDEIMFSIADVKEQYERQEKQLGGMEIKVHEKPVFRMISEDENTATIAGDIVGIINMKGNSRNLHLRFTSVIVYKNEKWIVVHWHISSPVDAVPGDAWNLEAWNRKNEELRKKVEEKTFELKKSLDELKLTQAQLIQSEKMASLGELTAGIAHEIQNPLNFVNNFSEVNTELIAEMKNEIDKENFEEVKAIANDIEANEQKINHHGKRADAIVKGMLQHSRSSSGVKEPTNINALADEYLRLAYHGFRAKDKSFNATMKTDFDQSIGNINVVPQEIGRVILNLITNAFYAVLEKKSHQPEGYDPSVSISTKKSGDKVMISVKDNGNGIPQKVMDKIFQPFFTTKPAGLGTGLGLSLSYDIVKAHGGELKVETKEGEGSEFVINLPE